MTERPAQTPESLLDAVCERAARLNDASPLAVTRVRVRSGGTSVEVEWTDATDNGTHVTTTGPARRAPTAPAEVEYVRAPLVGTFYRAPTSGAPPFVDVGDTVEPGQQVGIIEAVKLMNPIEADRAGRVVEVLVADAAMVEYEQPLLALQPLDQG